MAERRLNPRQGQAIGAGAMPIADVTADSSGAANSRHCDGSSMDHMNFQGEDCREKEVRRMINMHTRSHTHGYCRLKATDDGHQREI